MSKGQPREILVVQSKLKDYIKSKDMMSGSDAVEAASNALYGLLDAAIARAAANGRKTLRSYDI